MINTIMNIDWTVFLIKSVWWIIPLSVGLWLTWLMDREA